MKCLLIFATLILAEVVKLDSRYEIKHIDPLFIAHTNGIKVTKTSDGIVVEPSQTEPELLARLLIVDRTGNRDFTFIIPNSPKLFVERKLVSFGVFSKRVPSKEISIVASTTPVIKTSSDRINFKLTPSKNKYLLTLSPNISKLNAGEILREWVSIEAQGKRKKVDVTGIFTAK